MPDVPIDGTHCMACGHPWNAHRSVFSHRLDPKCAATRGICNRVLEKLASYNAHDWQSRILELEAKLDEAQAALRTAMSHLTPPTNTTSPYALDYATSLRAIEKARKDHHVTP